MRIGIVGYGYWGPNLVRNACLHPNLTVAIVADQSLERLALLKKAYPSIQTTTNTDDLLQSEQVEAVIIATPVRTHYALARAALSAGKHVLIEKPLAGALHEAQELVELAEKKKLVLMVDHTYLYTGAVEEMKKIIDADGIGGMQSFSSTRFNLGLFQSDINVLWDLAPHDLSILLYLNDSLPSRINAVGVSHTKNGIENIAYLTMRYDNGMIAHVGTSWVSPVKIRQILIAGDKKMISFNDMEMVEKVKVYDAGYTVRTGEEKSRLYMDYRSGDIHIPKISTKEALSGVIADFVQAIRTGAAPRSDAALGLRIVRVLDAAERSIKKGGAEVALS